MRLLLVYTDFCLHPHSHTHSDCVGGCQCCQRCASYHSLCTGKHPCSVPYRNSRDSHGFSNRAILSSTNYGCPSDTACRVYYWVIDTGGTARLSFTATYAVVVFVIIRRSNTAVRPIILLLSVLAIWMFVISFNALLFSPQIVESNLLEYSECVPCAGTQLWALYTVPFIIIFVLVPISIAIVLPCAAICFIKTNIIEGRPQLSKPMVKFALFLLLGNTLALLGQATPVILASLTRDNRDDINYMLNVAINYTNGILLTLSFIPTPILILVYFKPIWKQLTKLPAWLFKCCKGGNSGSVEFRQR